MNKQVFIINGTGSSGKDTWVNYLSKYIPTYHYSIANLPKEAATLLGWGGGKTEKDRKFLSDIVDISTEYNDAPFQDVVSLVADFKNGRLGADVLVIDMRDPLDIARAVETFGAKTIFIKNPRVEAITSNHADRDVEDFNYDFVINNDGTLEDLDRKAEEFVKVLGNI